MTPDEIAREIARCDAEIARMEAQEAVAPAYLTTLGIEDWRRERGMLQRELRNLDIDPETGIRPISKWGDACRRGFVSDSRFGSGPVIKRTNREVTRRWLRSRRQGA